MWGFKVQIVSDTGRWVWVWVCCAPFIPSAIMLPMHAVAHTHVNLPHLPPTHTQTHAHVHTYKHTKPTSCTHDITL